MNEVHEVPAGEALAAKHLMSGASCICLPEVIERWQNGLALGVVIRHRAYTAVHAASAHLVRGF